MEDGSAMIKVLYEDNHLLCVEKPVNVPVQPDGSGDISMLDLCRQYLKETYNKPGNVFCGVVHRLDRPVGGLVIFAKTSKALARLNEMFRNGDVHKTYWAITASLPADPEGELTHYITTTEANNKSYASLRPKPSAKEARLRYRVLASSERYHLLEVQLLTGRKHQIRVQLSAIGCPLRGDLKYGAPRSNRDGSISLMARHIEFVHPVSKHPVSLTAPVPAGDPLWQAMQQAVEQSGNRDVES